MRRVTLHTIRADVDYATAEALTTYGILGVKVWIFKGEVIGDRAPERSKPVKNYVAAKRTNLGKYKGIGSCPKLALTFREYTKLPAGANDCRQIEAARGTRKTSEAGRANMDSGVSR